MREKLLNLMKNEGLKSSQLAEMLEINPAGISHILAGRNKPGFDLLQKILRRFPQISPDWLLLDNGPMYRADKNQGTGLGVTNVFNTSIEPKSEAADFDPRGQNDLFQQNTFSSSPTSGGRTTSPLSGSPETPAGARNLGSPEVGGFGQLTGQPAAGQTSASVSRIVIFYDDQTCETYTPTKR